MNVAIFSGKMQISFIQKDAHCTLEHDCSSRRIQLVKHQFHHSKFVFSWLSASSALNFSSLSVGSLSINDFAKVSKHCSLISLFFFGSHLFFSSAVALLLRSRSLSASVSCLFLSNDELHNIQSVCRIFTVY